MTTREIQPCRHLVKQGCRTERMMILLMFSGVVLSLLLLVVLGVIWLPAADNGYSSEGPVAEIAHVHQDITRNLDVLLFQQPHRNLRSSGGNVDLDQYEPNSSSGHNPADYDQYGSLIQIQDLFSYADSTEVLHSSTFLSAHKNDQAINSAGIHVETASASEATTLPTWMMEYFAWHNESMARLNADPSQWKNYQYIVMRCLKMDHKCGGASDRLQSIPFVLKMAANFQRLLFIEWEKPAPLSEFLVPVVIDWIIPDWFVKTSKRRDVVKLGVPYVLFQRSPTILSDHHLYRMKNHNETIMVDMRYQSSHHGREYYNKYLAPNEPDFDSVYSRVWASLFRPSPQVQNLIDEERREFNLESNGYFSLHVRSMYFKDNSHKASRTESAVDCAFHLVSTISNDSATLLVTSDSHEVTKSAQLYGKAHSGRRVVASTGMQPLHLDRGSKFLEPSKEIDWMEYPVSAYYSIFVDLYLLSQGDCVIYDSVGGYGRWASRIANHSCAFNMKEVECGPTSSALETVD